MQKALGTQRRDTLEGSSHGSELFRRVCSKVNGTETLLQQSQGKAPGLPQGMSSSANTGPGKGVAPSYRPCFRTDCRPNRQLGQNLPVQGKLVRGDCRRPAEMETCWKAGIPCWQGGDPLRVSGNQSRTWMGLNPKGRCAEPAANHSIHEAARVCLAQFSKCSTLGTT